MSEFEVTSINKPDRNSRHEHIMFIGNNQKLWKMKREVAMSRIESKAENFYTVDRSTGKKMYIAVVREANKNPYLRTHADGKWNDNLLAQDECSPQCNIVS